MIRLPSPLDIIKFLLPSWFKLLLALALAIPMFLTANLVLIGIVPVFLIPFQILAFPVSWWPSVFAIPLAAYLWACIFFAVVSFIWDSNRWLIIILVAAVLLLGGIDEPVGRALHPPDLSCQVDTDCAYVDTTGDACGEFVCANKGWERYDGAISRALALSCAFEEVECVCRQNVCGKK